MFTITTTIDCYLLPGDGDAAKALFLEHLKDPYEMWIVAYSFTLEPMIDEIIANNTAVGPIHVYLDLSQSRGTYEQPMLQKLVAGGVEVTVGTSPAGTSFITHTKGIVCDDSPPWCWEGSVNFSASGWMQVNTALFFHSKAWRDQFVAQFTALRDYAWTNERASQLLAKPPKGVTIGAAQPVGAMPAPVEPQPGAATGAKPARGVKKAGGAKKTGAAKKAGASKAGAAKKPGAAKKR